MCIGPGSVLDHLCHHANLVVMWSPVKIGLGTTCHQAHIGVKVEVHNNLSRDHSNTCPADIPTSQLVLGQSSSI